MARKKKWSLLHDFAREELLDKLEAYISRMEKRRVTASFIRDFEKGPIPLVRSTEIVRKKELMYDLQTKAKRLRGFRGLRIMRYLGARYAAYESERQSAEEIQVTKAASSVFLVKPLNDGGFMDKMPLEIRKMIYRYALPSPRILILTLNLDDIKFGQQYPDHEAGMHVIRVANGAPDTSHLPLHLHHIHNAAPPALASVSTEARAYAAEHYVEINEDPNSPAVGYVDFSCDKLYLTNEEINNTPQFQRLEDFFIPAIQPHMHRIQHLIIDADVWRPSTPSSPIWTQLTALESISVVFHEEGCSWCNNFYWDIGFDNDPIENNSRGDPKTLAFELVMPEWMCSCQELQFEMMQRLFSEKNEEMGRRIRWKGPFAQLVDRERCCEPNSTADLVCQEYYHWLPRRSRLKREDR